MLVPTPKVSILVPCYNVDKYIRQCMDSIVSQTLKDIEIICINDGSTDNTLSVLREFADKDERVTIIDKPNSGYGHSMNMGLKRATGEYVGIVESDDFVEPNMFEELYSLAITRHVKVVKCDFYRHTEKKGDKKENILPECDLEQVINPREKSCIFYCQPCIWSAIYERQFLNEFEIDFLESPGASFQDIGFNFKVWAMADACWFTPIAFYHYRCDNAGASVKDTGKVLCVADEWRNIERYMDRYPAEKNASYRLRNHVKLINYMWNINRLTGEGREEFLTVFRSQYGEIIKNEGLKRDCFTNKKWFKLLSHVYQKNFKFKILLALENVKRVFLKTKIKGDKKVYLVFFGLLKVCEKQANMGLPNFYGGRGSMAKISIIVPVYNVEAYIEECLSSLIGQTFHDIEIICVDDCSTDASMDIAQRFAENDGRIRIIKHSENKGQSTARNTGLNEATAPYVMFCDSDDFFAPDMCEKMYAAIRCSACELAICGVGIKYEWAEEWRVSDEEYYRLKFRGKRALAGDVLLDTDVSVWNKIFKKEIIDKYEIRFPEGLRYEDAFFFNAYTAVAKTAFFLNEKLYNYRRRQGSIMDETFSKKNSDSIHHLEIAVKLYEFYKKWGLLDDRYEYFSELFARYYDFSLTHAVSDRDIKRIEKRAASWAKAWLKETDQLPASLKLRIEVIKSNANHGVFPFRIKRLTDSVKLYFMGIPVFRVKYGERCDRYSVLGIRVYKRGR